MNTSIRASGGPRSHERAVRRAALDFERSMDSAAMKCWPDSKRSRDSVAKMAGRCPGGQAEMIENPSNHGGIFNGSDDLQGAATMQTVLNVDIEYPF